MNFGRAEGLFNIFSPEIRKGIWQVAKTARWSSSSQNVRSIDTTENELSSGRTGSTPLGRKIQEITKKVESVADFIENNENKAQGIVNHVSRKIKA